MHEGKIQVEIRIGSIWRDRDRRTAGNRYIKVASLLSRDGQAFAVCQTVRGSGIEWEAIGDRETVILLRRLRTRFLPVLGMVISETPASSDATPSSVPTTE
jgi:hypothetical protein